MEKKCSCHHKKKASLIPANQLTCNNSEDYQPKVNANSPEPNDGTFIHHEDNSFSANGVVRYGEETDVDDI